MLLSPSGDLQLLGLGIVHELAENDDDDLLVLLIPCLSRSRLFESTSWRLVQLLKAAGFWRSGLHDDVDLLSRLS